MKRTRIWQGVMFLSGLWIFGYAIDQHFGYAFMGFGGGLVLIAFVWWYQD